MKIEKISEDVIKISLTDADFKNRNLDTQEDKPDSSPYEKVLIDAIYHAEIEFDFDVSECHVLYEPAMSKDKDHVITITRTQNAINPQANVYELSPSLLYKSLDFLMNLINTEEEGPDGLLDKILNQDLITPHFFILEEEKNTETEEKNKDSAFEICAFDDFENLLSLIQARPQTKAIPASLYNYNSKYYVVYKLSKRNFKAISQLRDSITEFDGHYIPAFIALPILEEYGKKVIKRGAFSVLQKNFIHK